MIIQRKIKSEIETALEYFPAVALIGPRQVGKTTLARQIFSTRQENAIYLDLEKESDLYKLEEPELFLQQNKEKLIILDEIQQKGQLFSQLRVHIDEQNRPGCFLLLGSASPALIQQTSETLAGRIRFIELAPFSFEELGNDASIMNILHFRGGFPRSYLAPDNDTSLAWRDSFIKTYIERDLPQLGLRMPSTAMHRFWQMIAHVHGQQWNASQIAQSMGVSQPTCQRYLDILQDIFIVRILEPYHANLKKRLVKSPKIYIRDSGILHALHRISSYNSLLGNPIVGASWEGWAIEQILATIVQRRWGISYYRSAAGAEIDLLLAGENNKKIAIEIKFSLKPKPQRGFFQAYEDLSCTKGFVAYPGTSMYELKPSIYALPAMEFHRIEELCL